MAEHIRDRIVGVALMAFAVVWCAVVWMTVPNAYGGAVVGPRDMPLWLGFSLGLLALALIGRSYISEAPAPVLKEARSSPPPERKSEWLAGGVVAVSVVTYALFMEWFGFVVATVVVVFALLRFGLGVRSLPLLFGMSLSLSFGVYFVMGWLMGVYLPHGTVISPF